VVVQLQVEVARLQIENAALRQRVGELERLVEQVKTLLWARAERRGG
jgi:hypothetical protein